MADLRESALTQQSDCKWVRALDANGNSIRISKEDLAEVLGGLIPIATSKANGLIAKKQSGFANFFNSYIANTAANGYLIGENTSAYCSILLFFTAWTGTDSAALIISFKGNGTACYIRKLVGANLVTPRFYLKDKKLYCTGINDVSMSVMVLHDSTGYNSIGQETTIPGDATEISIEQ